MKMVNLFVLAITFFGASASFAQTATSSASAIVCSGHWKGQYFYAYTYQYVYSLNGYVQQEQHQFQFQGFLQNESFRSTGYDADFALYESRNYRLAVPLHDNTSLYVKDRFDRGRIDSPSGRRRWRPQWEVLCQR